MMRYLLIAVVLLLLAGSGVGLYFFLKPDPVTQRPGGSFPYATTTSAGVDVLTVRGADGKGVTVRDFFKNGSAEVDPANVGTYYLAGSSGYCPVDETCPESDLPFNVVFFEEDQSFVIALLDEPLGENRTKAELYLQQQLGIPAESMCKLNYYLGVDSYVNETYSGRNLLFSFCPGAVPLP